VPTQKLFKERKVLDKIWGTYPSCAKNMEMNFDENEIYSISEGIMRRFNVDFSLSHGSLPVPNKDA
jgi:hypothetical protein